MSGLQKAGAQNYFHLQFTHKLKPLSISDAKKAGFTVLKRLGKGEYEKQ